MIYSNKKSLIQVVLACAFVVVAGILPVFASGPHVAMLIRKDGRRVSGNVRYLASSRAYEVNRSGSNARQQVQASDVQRVVLKTQPAGLQAAIANVNRGNYAAAIPVLKKIRSDYEMFGPDVVAAQYLAKAYLAMGKVSEADRLCREVINLNPDAMNEAGFVSVYWDVLLKGKKYATLKKSLDQVIQTGSREISAIALVKRGDVLMAENKIKEALLDGYLRVVLMYRDIKSIQPEALYKAVKAHQKLGENTYAEKWRKLLLSGYPTSSYAKKM